MVRMLRSVVVAAMLVAAVPAAATAQTQFVDEFKFGVLAHDIGLFDKPVESGSDINFEMLFTPPEFFRVIGSPRPARRIRKACDSCCRPTHRMKSCSCSSGSPRSCSRCKKVK